MSDVAIRVEGLGKKYRIGAQQAPYRTLRETLVDLAAAPVRRLAKAVRGHGSDPADNTIWALKDVSFEVRQGEVLGIIGRNGAGKSTLLKILSRITKPTEGHVDLTGRVGSLLEVGTGFHPELTGRENVFLNGAILGMRRNEIERKFDEIVAFAEIEKFLDTPVKHYSSGMYVRLAFAVAAHLEPEILLVDEVLAVGDTEFQKKCLGKMRDVAGGGRTVLFVSHNTAAISSLCPVTVLVEKGKLMGIGPTRGVVQEYLAGSHGLRVGDVVLDSPSVRRNSLADSEFKWTRIRITNCLGEITSTLGLREPFKLTIEGDLKRKTSDLRVGLSVESSMGFSLFNSYASDDGISAEYPLGHLRFEVEFPVNILAPGEYTVGLGANGPRIIDWIPEAIGFSVEPVARDHHGTLRSNFSGFVLYPCKWSRLD